MSEGIPYEKVFLVCNERNIASLMVILLTLLRMILVGTRRTEDSGANAERRGHF